VALNSRSDAGGFVSLYRGYRVDTTAAQDFIDLVLESGDAGLFN
jgi:hypothetical protein